MWTIAYTTHRGQRNGLQQDALLVDGVVYQQSMLEIASKILTSETALLAVADGVYSSPFAERASRIVLEALQQVFKCHVPERLAEGLITAWHVRRVKERLSHQLQAHQFLGSASTLAAVQLAGQRVAILNVGDSRIYHVNTAGQWLRVSKDHSLLQAYKDEGSAVCHGIEYASIYGMLDAAISADGEDPEAFPVHRVVIDLRAGETLVLCSDGVHDELGEQRMWALFDPSRDVAKQTTLWRNAVWLKGAHDNFSLIMVRAG